MLDYLQHCAPREYRILREFCVTQRCSVVLRGAICNGPRGKLLKLLRLSSEVCTHNAEVEGKSNKATDKGGLEYDLASNKMLYANVSTGYVAGGVNGGSLSLPVPEGVASPTFKPETITAYEVGSKNRFLDNRLQLNGDFYYYDFHNYQLTNPAFLNNNPLANVLVIDNVGQVTTYGLELNVDFALTAEDRLSAAVMDLALHSPSPSRLKHAYIQKYPTLDILSFHG